MSKSSKRVFIFYNSPCGIKFLLSSGRSVVIGGCPTSELVDLSSFALRSSGKFGVTELDLVDWQELVKGYGEMEIFRTGNIFSADSLESGYKMSRERSELLHGFEQLDPSKLNSQVHKED